MKKLTWRIWVLIIILAFSLLSILPGTFLQKGVIVTSVELNSTEFEQGLRQGQIIIEIDSQKIETIDEYTDVMQGKFISGKEVKTIIKTEDTEIILFNNESPKIIVSEIPNTNIKLGLDLEGGARALIQAQDKKLSSEEIKDLVDVTSNRLNEFGLSDLRVVPISDLAGNNFMLIEIAGATPKDLKEIISKQGKFEAKIGDEIVFIGGERDISSVARTGQQSGITRCDAIENGNICRFQFAVFLSEDAAKRFAEITKDIPVNLSNSKYLDKNIDFYLDDKLVSSISVSAGLKGRVTTQVSISGSGSGKTSDEAYQNAIDEMNKLQTILITGSLPYKLEIVKLDTISPILGKEIIRSILFAGLIALFAVAIVVFLRYKKIKSSLALVITSLSEVVIILGIASLIEWNLDLPSIAGIIATIGTGIDSQIIILDESKQKASLSLKQKLKRAFGIIMGAYFTAVVALIPLLWAGAGLLKGFAVTTLIGITVGILITRPAFTDMIRKIGDE
jgi:preprotein translocase subunit SecD